MRSIYIIILSTFLHNFTFAQCSQQTFSTQQELDAFFTENPDCVEFESITLVENDIHDLSKMNNVKFIGALRFEGCEGLSSLIGLNGLERAHSIYLYGCSIINLVGLENLKQVDSSFAIYSNHSLINLNGMNNVKSITNLNVSGNINLNNIEALGNLKALKGISFSRNGLGSLQGIENIDTIKKEVLIFDENISNIDELINIIEIDYIQLFRLPNLKNIDGLGNLKNVYVGLSIVECDSLYNLEPIEDIEHLGSLGLVRLANITHIPGFNNLDSLQYLNIDRCNRLKTITGFHNLKSISAGFLLFSNDSLLTIPAFTQLTELGQLRIKNNLQLTNLPAFNNISEIKGDLRIQENPSLEHMDGFNDLISVSGDWWIEQHNVETITAFQNLKSVAKNFLTLLGKAENVEVFKNLETIGEDFNVILPLVEQINFSSLKRVGKVMGIWGEQLINLEGLNKLDTLPSCITIGNANSLTTLEHLKDKIILADSKIYINKAESLKNLEGLEGINHVDLQINAVNLVNIEALSNFSTGSLGLYSFQLADISPLRNLSYIENDFILSLSKLESLSPLQNLKHVGGSFWLFADSLKNMNGLGNLTDIGGNFRIGSCDILKTLSGVYDGLKIGDKITLWGNDSLTDCSANFLCQHLERGGSYDIRENGLRCTNADEIIDNCDFNKFSYNAFYDINRNGIQEENEPNIHDITFTLNEEQLHFVSDNEPLYRYLEISNQENIFSFIENPNWELTTDSSSFMIFLDQITAPYKFGFSPKILASDMKSKASLYTTKCSSKTTLDLIAINNGNTINSGTLWIEFESLQDSFAILNSPDSISNNQFGFFFTNNLPGTRIIERLNYTIPGPPNVMEGDSIKFKTWVDFTNGNNQNFSDTSLIIHEVYCSSDSNSKTVSPNRENGYTLFNEELTYTILFQNTGEADSYDLIIRDTLDHNLDVSTFKLLSTSHEEILKTSIEDERFITFEFRNIYLPNTTSDFQKSNGYVSYTIRPLEGLNELTSIENTASIYFDSNPTIVTNTTNNILVNRIPTSIQNIRKDLDIQVFPNPSNGLIYFKGTDLEIGSQIEIYSINGKLINKMELNASMKIDLNAMDAGIYFIQIYSGTYIYPVKIIMQ